MNETSNKTNAVEKIVQRCAPHLSGHQPDVQGAALSELVAGYIVGYPPEAREHMLQLLVRTARDLTELNARELRGEGV